MGSAPTSSAAAPRLQFTGVQYLRAIAALMVAYLHLTIQIPAYVGPFEAALAGSLNLGTGVDIFFVISGFIMVVSTRETMRPGAFFLRRLVRIVPLYWFMTMLVVLGFLLHPDWFRTTVVMPGYVFRSLAFIPYANPGHGGDYMPILVPGWSLNFEMAFYAVFALSLLLPPRIRVIAVGVVFAVCFALGRMAQAQPSMGALGFYGDLRIAEFWLGMVIGAQSGAALNRRVPAPLVAGLVVLAMGVLVVPVRLYASLAPTQAILACNVLPAAVVVWGIVALEVQGRIAHHPTLRALGDASYSIYLSHILTLGVVRVLWIRAGLGAEDLAHVAAFAVVAMLAVVIVGTLVYKLAEQPLLQGMRKVIRI